MSPAAHPKTLTCWGETLTYREWGERVNMNPCTIMWRVEHGWAPEMALRVKPVWGGSGRPATAGTGDPADRPKRQEKTLTCWGSTKTVREWSAQTHIPADVIRARIRDYGWSVERALTTPYKSHGPLRERVKPKIPTRAELDQDKAWDGHKHGALCRGCRHYRDPGSGSKYRICHYLLDTDESRAWTKGKRDEKCVRILKWRAEHGVPLSDRERERLEKSGKWHADGAQVTGKLPAN